MLNLGKWNCQQILISSKDIFIETICIKFIMYFIIHFSTSKPTLHIENGKKLYVYEKDFF